MPPLVPNLAADILDINNWCFTSEVANLTTYYCYVISPDQTGQVYSDQTGMFKIASSTTNNYLIIVYDSHSNGILAKPMPKHTCLCTLHTFKILHTRLTADGLCPMIKRFDNKAQTILKQYMSSEGIVNQLVTFGTDH
jgi:hypothetical protein